MSNANQPYEAPKWTNPLQNNNAALMVVGYVAGIIAAKFTIFDLQTWNYIIFTGGGIVFAGVSYVLNRKSVVISTVADLPEVKSVSLDRTVPGTGALGQITPDNVVVK